ncbi:MAG: CDP-archaeol synthase [Chlamydiales bacterium]|nr:CDP-archaeol synthase [Chlamydiia bacterium]MCP5508530.1 CDP-archaeol synthase [Chlamydiales bacterium]
MSFSKMSNLSQRLTVSAVIVTLILFAIYFATNTFFRPIFVLLTAGFISYALYELYHLAQQKGMKPLERTGIICSVAYIFSIYLSYQHPSLLLLPMIVIALTMLIIFGYYFFRGSDPLVNLSVTTFGVAYLTIPLSCLIAITYYFNGNPTQDGRWWLFYLIFVTKMTDTGGYFIGKNFGKSKFFAHISPNKTWEGAIAGLCFAVASSAILCLVAHNAFETSPFLLTYWQSLWLGLLIGILAQFGDLAESRLKRDMGVKDSNTMPGLGGILDVVDSLVFTSPLLYIFLKLHY